jgi:hypothetical protein
MPDLNTRRMSSDSAPDYSRAIRERQPKSRQNQTFSPVSFQLRDVAQEAHTHRMMGFGQRRLLESSSLNEVEHSVGTYFDQTSTTYYSATSSQIENGNSIEGPYQPPKLPEPTFDVYQEECATVRFTPDPRLRAPFGGSHTLPIRGLRNLAPSASLRPSSPDTTIAEEFYRSSRCYRANPGEGKTTVGIDRTPTPFSRADQTASNRPARHYATLPLPSSQQQEYVYDPALSYEPPSPTKPLPRRIYDNCVRPRLPADYRPETPFSFDKPNTPTPFSSEYARTMSPSHPLYNAPRMSGVDLEIFAMGQTMRRNGAKIHRTMWPEEVAEMAANVNGMMANLLMSGGAVRDEKLEVGDVVGPEAEEVVELKVDKKKGKFRWLKKLLVKKKQVTESDEHRPVQQETLGTGPTPSSLRAPRGTGPEEAPQNLSSITAAASSSQTSTCTTFSEPSQEEPAHDSSRKPARSTFGKQMSRKQTWWHIRLPRTHNRVSKVQRTIRSRTIRRRAGY